MMLKERLRDKGIGYEIGFEDPHPQRPFLVMIHGAGGRAALWHNQVRLLAEIANTVALDLPGHGESPGPSMKLISEYAAWLARLLEEAFAGQSVILMGHSMGGAIVQEVALAAPHTLHGLVLVATGPRLQVAPALLQGFSADFNKTIDTLIGYAYAPGADPVLIRQGALLMKESGPQVVLGDFEACDAFDRQTELVRIPHPCLIICGDSDKLTPPRLSKALHQGIRASSLVILPSCGHMAMIEAPEALAGAVRDFLISMSR